MEVVRKVLRLRALIDEARQHGKPDHDSPG